MVWICLDIENNVSDSDFGSVGLQSDFANNYGVWGKSRFDSREHVGPAAPSRPFTFWSDGLQGDSLHASRNALM